ncbi:MAG: hypothetical protein HKUEN01_02200 [Candidatus Kuenenia stuttgartiensis]|nr:MAG: hypothetical protein HKUEN01_02200 [Candidatus Kuenenia stuttgartiensis]
MPERRGSAVSKSFFRGEAGKNDKCFHKSAGTERKIYIKAKTDKHGRFWGLYCHISKDELLREAYRLAKANDGVPGIDGKDFEDIEREGLEGFLEGIRQELLERTYRPLPNRRVEIPKGNGKTRTLGIPTIRDRVVQGALKLILEPIFEADFKDCSYG